MRYFWSGFGSEGATPGAGLDDVPAGACAGGFDVVEQQPTGEVEAGAGVADFAAQQLGTIGFGALTPAISEPSPSFCSVGASSFPLESRPFAD